MDGVSPALTDLLRNVPGRDHSYSLIQGPPGAGKTYQSSKRIVELLRQGKRVGVSSTTHKAINNLLASIERDAAEAGVSFTGVKKSSSEDQFLENCSCVTNTCDNEDVAGGDFQLVAGTAFLFARPEFSGLSVLEHLLGDLAIVPEERGEFLAETRRLHPDVCTFISDAVYDGKLHPAAGKRATAAGTGHGCRLSRARAEWDSVRRCRARGLRSGMRRRSGATPDDL